MSASERFEKKQKFIPETGFNVVGLDDFDGELYLIAHVDSSEEANALKDEKSAGHTDRVFVYSPRS